MRLVPTHKIPEGIKKTIHVNSPGLNQALEPNEPEPACLTIRVGNLTFTAHHVRFKGETHLKQDLRNPENGTIKAWIETKAEIVLYFKEPDEVPDLS